MPKYLCDLHMHTNRSDGSDSPKELIDNAADLGMAVIAITDHDIRPPATITTDDGVVDITDYARSKGLLLLRGIEISCETDIEDTHIVGFGCDWSSPYFDKLEESVINSKIDSYKKLITALNAGGFAITWEEVLGNNGSPVPEEAIQKKMLFELMARKGFVKSWSDAKLLMKNTPQYQINRKKPTAASAIQAIRDTGGISILAHPYLIADTVIYKGDSISRDQFIRSLIAVGLNGIEANYTYDKTSYGGSMTKDQIAKEVTERYGALVDLISGGSDYHADQKKGVVNARAIGEAGIDVDYFHSNRFLKKYHL